MSARLRLLDREEAMRRLIEYEKWVEEQAKAKKKLKEKKEEEKKKQMEEKRRKKKLKARYNALEKQLKEKKDKKKEAEKTRLEKEYEKSLLARYSAYQEKLEEKKKGGGRATPYGTYLYMKDLLGEEKAKEAMEEAGVIVLSEKEINELINDFLRKMSDTERKEYEYIRKRFGEEYAKQYILQKALQPYIDKLVKEKKVKPGELKIIVEPTGPVAGKIPEEALEVTFIGVPKSPEFELVGAYKPWMSAVTLHQTRIETPGVETYEALKRAEAIHKLAEMEPSLSGKLALHSIATALEIGPKLMEMGVPEPVAGLMAPIIYAGGTYAAGLMAPFEELGAPIAVESLRALGYGLERYSPPEVTGALLEAGLKKLGIDLGAGEIEKLRALGPFYLSGDIAGEYVLLKGMNKILGKIYGRVFGRAKYVTEVKKVKPEEITTELLEGKDIYHVTRVAGEAAGTARYIGEPFEEMTKARFIFGKIRSGLSELGSYITGGRVKTITGYMEPVTGRMKLWISKGGTIKELLAGTKPGKAILAGLPREGTLAELLEPLTSRLTTLTTRGRTFGEILSTVRTGVEKAAYALREKTITLGGDVKNIAFQIFKIAKDNRANIIVAKAYPNIEVKIYPWGTRFSSRYFATVMQKLGEAGGLTATQLLEQLTRGIVTQVVEVTPTLAPELTGFITLNMQLLSNLTGQKKVKVIGASSTMPNVVYEVTTTIQELPSSIEKLTRIEKLLEDARKQEITEQRTIGTEMYEATKTILDYIDELLKKKRPRSRPEEREEEELTEKEREEEIEEQKQEQVTKLLSVGGMATQEIEEETTTAASGRGARLWFHVKPSIIRLEKAKKPRVEYVYQPEVLEV